MASSKLVKGVTATVFSVVAIYGISKVDPDAEVDSLQGLKKKQGEILALLGEESAPHTPTQRTIQLAELVSAKLSHLFPRPLAEWNSVWDLKKSSESSCSDLAKDAAPSSASRVLFLVRHGQYLVEKTKEEDKHLTCLGQEQLDLTGKRLDELGICFDRLVASTMTRAQESANLVHKRLKPGLQIENDCLLEEGAPVRPEPPSENWNPPDEQFAEDGPRIEAAFKKYFHRAPPHQQNDSHEIIVCHGNVIRYFVCRALQLPPEAWLRIGLNHGSITTITIRPNGRVVLNSLGVTGFMPPEKITAI